MLCFVQFDALLAGCWPYSSTANRISLLTRQSVNQKAVFRTSSSLWCTDTAQLSGTVLSIINGTSFAPDASGLVVQVQWNNGIVGFHRMGAFGEWDLDTPCEFLKLVEVCEQL